MAQPTYAEYREVYGATRLASAIDGSEVLQQNLVEIMINAAWLVLEGALLSIGFSEPPVGVSWGDHLSPGDPAKAAKIEDLTLIKTSTLVSAYYVQSIDETTRTEEAREDCMTWLLSGAFPVAPPAVAATSTRGYSNQPGASIALNPCNLRRMRMVRV
jgi:hypothetical protein